LQRDRRRRKPEFSFPTRAASGFIRDQQMTAPATPKYKRIVLKISGEALREPGSGDNISPQIVNSIARQIAEIRNMGVEVAVVVGGGNIWRGLAASHRGMNRATADYMGMLATVINGLALMSAIESIGVSVRVQTAIEMNNVAEPFILRRATRHLELGHVVIFVAGTGNPFFSTDTTAALRANEIGAQVILKATKVDGVYDSDPMKNPDAKKFLQITYGEALARRLKVMDSTAFSLCMDNRMPIIVFDMSDSTNIRRAVLGENVGSLVSDTQEAA
jgi:uridylate kinase